MKTPNKPEAAALQQATDKAEREANSRRFYEAKHDLFFCNQVVALAAYATSMQRSLQLIESAGAVFPSELQKISQLCPALDDWHEMPNESLPWALNLAAERMQLAADVMEKAFMAAERAGEVPHAK